MESLRADVDAILDMRVPDPEDAPVELAEYTVLDALFTSTIASLPLPHEHSKKYLSRDSEEACARNKERTDMEAARRASLIDEEARQMRAHDLASTMSSSR